MNNAVVNGSIVSSEKRKLVEKRQLWLRNEPTGIFNLCSYKCWSGRFLRLTPDVRIDCNLGIQMSNYI